MIEISKQFRFESAHTLQRTVDAEPSRRVHGHSYRAEVTVRGTPDAGTGMLMDLGLLQRILDEAACELDHHLLDEVPGLGPATMENLVMWIWRRLAPCCPHLAAVSVYRDSLGERCTYAPDPAG